VCQQSGSPFDVGLAERELGHIAFADGDARAAENHLRCAFATAPQL